jgi:hypothetical protein
VRCAASLPKHNFFARLYLYLFWTLYRFSIRAANRQRGFFFVPVLGSVSLGQAQSQRRQGEALDLGGPNIACTR